MPVHGVAVDKLTGGVRAIETQGGAVVGILAYCSELTEGDLRLLRTPADVEACDDGTGTLVPYMDAFRAISNAPVVVCAISQANIANAAGSASTFTRAFRFLQAESVLGVKPSILASCNVGGVAADLISVGNKLEATVYCDGPNSTDAAAITAAAAAASSRVGFSDPCWIDQQDRVLGQSILYAAHASVVNYWESASNKEVPMVKALSRPISFELGDETCTAEMLNDGKVNTIIFKNGFRLWGGLTTGIDPDFKFLCVTRTDDIIGAAIKEGFMWAVDKAIGKTFVEDLVETIRAFLRTEQARGAIQGGDAWPNKELNSPTSVKAGNLYLDYDFSATYPAYQIRARRHLTDRYLANIFA